MITLPDSNPFYRTINDIAKGKADFPGNKIEPVSFKVISIKGWTTHQANSMWAATEYLKEHKINPYDVIWL